MNYIVNEIRKELDQSTPKGDLPLEFTPGSHLQIDHGELECEIAGYRSIAYLFVASIPGQVIRYCQVYPTKASEAWGQFHESAFRFFGGVFSALVYDNDSVLVKEIIGSERKQTSFSLSLEDYYNFDSVFCNAGAGQEKGSVEKSVGFCRKNFLAGLPKYSSWSELNQYLEIKCNADIQSKTHYRSGKPLFEILQKCKEALIPLPASKEWFIWKELKENDYQIVTYKNHWYSAPERYIGKKLKVAISINKIKIYEANELIATHERQYEPEKDSLILEHYLNQLKRKPNALLDCAAVRQHKFPPLYEQLWERLYSRFDRRKASQEFIDILILKRKYSEDELSIAIELSLEKGCISAQGILSILNALTAEPLSYYKSTWLNDINPSLAQRNIQKDFDLSIYADLHEMGGSHV